MGRTTGTEATHVGRNVTNSASLRGVAATSNGVKTLALLVFRVTLAVNIYSSFPPHHITVFTPRFDRGPNFHDNSRNMKKIL